MNKRTSKISAAAEFDMAEVMTMTVKTSFLYKGKQINLEVFAEKVTPEFQEQLQAANDKSEVEAVRFLIHECVRNWSLNWQGNPFPPTAENIGKCPFSFLAPCSEAVLSIWSGNVKSASKSEITSEQTES